MIAIPDTLTFWRPFLSRPWLEASALALLATFVALALSVVAPAPFTSLDWALYDQWMSHRTAIPVSPSLVIVTRDQASEEEFGSGPWDRAVLARVITAAHESGAATIGLELPLDHASPAQLGGPASDTLLLEAMKAAGPVIAAYGQASSLTSDVTNFGHRLVTTHADRVVRTVPMTATADSQSLQAFGTSLYESFRHHASQGTSSPASTGDASILINYVGDGTLQAFATIPFSAVWNAIEHHESDRLTGWFTGKVAVFLPNPVGGANWLLPTGQTAGSSVVHLNLLNMLLTDNRLFPVGTVGRYFVTLTLAGLIAWLLLQVRGTVGLLLAGATLAVYAGFVVTALMAARLVFPLAMPLTATLLALVGTTGWSHLAAHRRLVLLEQDIFRLQQEAEAVREALILRETRTEALQEELALARTAVAQSTGQQETLSHTIEVLRARLAEAQTQEGAARSQLAVVEQQLHGLRAAAQIPAALTDAEVDRLREECRQLGIVTQDARLLRLYRDLKKGAKTPLTVLLLGEPGTGKELFARAVHRLSPRTGKTFIAVNMAALSPELFESELFGHTKGSFTGATADRRGYFELANHGTIFLDEIGDLRLDHQSKLLRVLQEKSFYRVGATIPTTVDVRIVAATNRDLQRGVTEGWFREDLYFRLTGLVFWLPPLRERTLDIPILTDILLPEIAAQMGKPPLKLSNDALRALLEQEWKGNVRELRHCLEQAVALSDGPILTIEFLRLHRAHTPATRPGKQMLPDPASDAAVLSCLRQHGFDMQATAKTLGWDRSTVTQRLKGLCFQALVESNRDQTKAALSIAGDPSHLRIVELKLLDYYGHLLSVVDGFDTPDEALLECKRRFKNLPDRHFALVDALVRQHFRQVSDLPGRQHTRSQSTPT